jgi:hypothetical protein
VATYLSVTTSMLFTVPISEASPGGLPYLNFVRSYLVKESALLGANLAGAGDTAGSQRRPAPLIPCRSRL